MRAARLLSGADTTPPALANFDSTTAFVRAIGRFLHGEGFPRLGMLPRPLAALLPMANRLPRPAKQWLYRKSGASEAIDPETLGAVDIEAFRQWVVDRYPDRAYPAILVGSANGAAVHLAASLGVPWLPQTFLVPVRRSLPPDAVAADLEWGRAPGRALLEANPDIQLHHMHDPNQDRLMVGELAYFRVKLRRLGAAYRTFVERTLAPGGSVVVIDCDFRWPATRVGDRHRFQFGGLGGLEPDEYHGGSPRVESFLRRHGASRTGWQPPTPDERIPEAEWGFEPSMVDAVTRFATDHGYRVRRVSFDHPRALSRPTAGLYRARDAPRRAAPDRLLVQCFALLDPWWTLRTGSVPYWLPFNTHADADALAAFLESRPRPFDEIYLMLFSNGIEAAGQAPIDRWRDHLAAARSDGRFIGVDPDAYPGDFGSYVRYHADLPGTISARVPFPPPTPLREFDRVMRADASVELTMER